MSDKVVMLNADTHEPIIGGRAQILDEEGKLVSNGLSISNRRGEVNIGDERVTDTTQIRFSAPKFKSQIFEKKDLASGIVYMSEGIEFLKDDLVVKTSSQVATSSKSSRNNMILIALGVGALAYLYFKKK
jgi:hypothetical protein